MTKQTHKEDAQDLEMRRYHEFKELCGGSVNIAREMAILAEQLYSAAALADAEQKLRNVWKCAFAESQEELACAQATIAEMRAALLTCTPEGFCDFDSVREALALPTNLDALREALALECERLEASLDESRGMAITAAGLRKEAAVRAELAGQEPFDADDPRFREAFDASLKSGNWPMTRLGEGYRSSITMMAFTVAYETVNRLRLYAAPVVQQKPEPAMSRYLRYTEGSNEPDPIERLRFFCSLAMTGRDWIDSEQFFADLSPVVQPENKKPHRWNDDGERCLDCGDKDWMADPYCSAATVVQPDDIKDAERYRWCRRHPYGIEKIAQGSIQEFDAAIDAAIEKERK